MKTVNIPVYREIPDVGLYLDQVVKYINSFLEGSGEVTASMLTNYIKHKIVKRYNRKTYVRDQISCFFFIALVKSILPLDKIKILLDQNSDPSFEAYYERFRNELILQQENGKSNEDEFLQKLVSTILNKIYLEDMIQTKEE